MQKNGLLQQDIVFYLLVLNAFFVSFWTIPIFSGRILGSALRALSQQVEQTIRDGGIKLRLFIHKACDVPSVLWPSPKCHILYRKLYYLILYKNTCALITRIIEVNFYWKFLLLILKEFSPKKLPSVEFLQFLES